MNIGELKEIIKDLPDDARVILQSDSEGNDFRWADGADFDGVIVEDFGWNAEIYSSSWSAEDADMDENDWQELLAKPRVLVIFPVN